MTDVFHLRLPPADTLELIRRSVDPPVRGFTASGFAGSKAFIGEVQDNSFWIVRRPRFRNGFRRVLRGKVVHTVNGSDVICQFRMSAATLTAVGAWYCLGFLIVIANYRSYNLGAVLSQLPIGILLVLGPVGLMAIGRLLSIPDENDVRALLRDLFSTVSRE